MILSALPIFSAPENLSFQYKTSEVAIAEQMAGKSVPLFFPLAHTLSRDKYRFADLVHYPAFRCRTQDPALEGCEAVESGRDSQSGRFFHLLWKCSPWGKHGMLQTATCLPCHQQGPREVPHGFSPDLRGHEQPSGLGSQAANEQPGASLLLTWPHALCEL